jgi:ribose/xylose/arabinose/galactoside ABC-type transport system permease subunit
LGITSGQSLSGLPKEILYLGSAMWLGLPASVWIFIALFIVAEVFLKTHAKGRAIYALGGNPEAARATGINVNRLGWALYVIGGLLAAIAGLLLTGRIASVTVDQGENLIFSVLAVAVLGGVSLDGGRGRMTNVFIATILLAVITNLLTRLQVPTFWVDASYGGIILVSLAIQGAARARRRAAAGRQCVGTGVATAKAPVGPPPGA